MTGPMGHQCGGRVRRCAVSGADEGTSEKQTRAETAARLLGFPVTQCTQENWHLVSVCMALSLTMIVEKEKTYGRVNVPD